MTKEDAIEKVLNKIIDSDWLQYGEFKVGAERLLDFMVDELGMLPPDRLPNSCSITTNERKVARDAYIYDRFKWEKE